MVQGVAFGDRIWPVRGVRAMNLQAVADARPRIDDETSLRQKMGQTATASLRTSTWRLRSWRSWTVLILHVRGDVINDFILEEGVTLDNCGVILVTILCGCHF